MRVDPDEGKLHLSSILDWFEGDFTEWVERTHPDRPATLTEYVIANAPPEVATRVAACADCEEVFVPYDWGLNDQRAP